MPSPFVFVFGQMVNFEFLWAGARRCASDSTSLIVACPSRIEKSPGRSLFPSNSHNTNFKVRLVVNFLKKKKVPRMCAVQASASGFAVILVEPPGKSAACLKVFKGGQFSAGVKVTQKVW